jgi:hypothetical protein
LNRVDPCDRTRLDPWRDKKSWPYPAHLFLNQVQIGSNWRSDQVKYCHLKRILSRRKQIVGLKTKLSFYLAMAILFIYMQKQIFIIKEIYKLCEKTNNVWICVLPVLAKRFFLLWWLFTLFIMMFTIWIVMT